MHRAGAVDFPSGPWPWSDKGFFKFVCLNERDSSAAPFPIGAMARIIDAVTRAYNKVGAFDRPNGNGQLIASYFAAVDPSAYTIDPNGGTGEASHMIIYRADDSLRIIFGDFGDEMDPEFSQIDQLSTDILGTFDTTEAKWVSVDETGDFTANHVGIWASPVLGVPNSE